MCAGDTELMRWPQALDRSLDTRDGGWNMLRDVADLN
jgi:hypothetical protein